LIPARVLEIVPKLPVPTIGTSIVV